MIAPFMPPQPLRGRKRRTDLRAVVDGIFYLLQSGYQWGLLPKDFPPKSTVHYYFKRFSGDGTWAAIHDALYRKTRDLEGCDESPSYAIVDSQSVKTGAEARGHVGFDAGKKVKGRKRHILVDTLGLILKAEVHSAGIQDRDGAALVFDRLTRRFPFIAKICGDGAYQGPIVQTSSPRPIEIVKRNQPGHPQERGVLSSFDVVSGDAGMALCFFIADRSGFRPFPTSSANFGRSYAVVHRRSWKISRSKL